MVYRHVHVYQATLDPHRTVDQNVQQILIVQVKPRALTENVRIRALVRVVSVPNVRYFYTPQYVLAKMVLLAIHSLSVDQFSTVSFCICLSYYN